MTNTYDFGDDVAIVTGGTKGIGREIALRLAHGGADVAATYHSDETKAAELREKLRDYDCDTCVTQCDVRDYDGVGAEFDTIRDEFGQPTVLVNNAGIVRNNVLMRMSPEDWGEVIETNLTGTFNCTQQICRPMMLGSGGRIVNVSSIAGQFGKGGQANYSASKAGVIAFTRAIAREMGSRGIRSNAVAPAVVETQMAEELPDGPNEWVEKNDVPMDRIAQPNEVADTVVFLASGQSSYINGEVIRVDGGRHA